GQKYPLVINGQKIWTDNLINSINPSSPTQVVGAVAEAHVEHAEQAVTAAKKAFEDWCRVSVEHRAGLLERVATIMDRRRFELSALEVFEVGKPWAEADGDIREAIDFLLFYAQQMRIRGLPRLTQHVPGEESYQHYWPRGVALVIAPWNFPMAILTGMVSAALVTGNTVIMKPAEQSAVCGAMLMEMFEEAGVPPGVLNYLPGKGRVIGQHLVEAAASLRVGNPEEPGITVGPVIDETAYRRMLEAIETGKKEATLAFQGEAPPEGFFVPPTIFTDVKPHMFLSCEEIFGPVL